MLKCIVVAAAPVLQGDKMPSMPVKEHSELLQFVIFLATIMSCCQEFLVL